MERMEYKLAVSSLFKNLFAKRTKLQLENMHSFNAYHQVTIP